VSQHVAQSRLEFYFLQQIFSFAARITTEATTCLATNLNSTLVIGCREARQIKNKTDGEGEPEFEVGQ